jgi:hypothetical protein
MRDRGRRICEWCSINTPAAFLKTFHTKGTRYQPIHGPRF